MGNRLKSKPQSRLTFACGASDQNIHRASHSVAAAALLDMALTTGSGRRYLCVLHWKDRGVSIFDVTDPSQPAVLETTFWPEGAPVRYSRRLCRCPGSVQQLRSASDGGACCAASVAS